MTDTETRNDARQYAVSIAEEIRQWEQAANGDPDALDAIAGDLDPDRINIELGELPHGDTYIESVALAVTVWRTDPDADGPDAGGRDTRIEILRTYGGPSCVIEWDSRYPAAFDVVTHWGGSAWRMTVHAPTLGDALAEVYA